MNLFHVLWEDGDTGTSAYLFSKESDALDWVLKTGTNEYKGEKPSVHGENVPIYIEYSTGNISITKVTVDNELTKA
jgi:hypothetical protein